MIYLKYFICFLIITAFVIVWFMGYLTGFDSGNDRACGPGHCWMIDHGLANYLYSAPERCIAVANDPLVPQRGKRKKLHGRSVSRKHAKPKIRL
jgi:hypothetical protein